MEISESEYNELVSARNWKAAHEQELKDFKKEHEEVDPDEQVKRYLQLQAEKDKARAERIAKLKASLI